MMARSPSHYESLNVTRDAPAEVIRAAYRSLSQKYHPDKNSGNRDAEHMMARLNAAYTVLSDSQQRERYDMQLLSSPLMDPHEAAPAPSLKQLGRYLRSWDRRLVAILLGAFSVVLVPVSWYIWTDHQSMLRIEQGMVYPAQPEAAPDTGWPTLSTAPGKAAASKASRVAVIQMAGPSGLGVDPAEMPAPAAPPKAAATTASSAKGSDFDRLTAMLKGMGLGLHKLDLPGMASNAKSAPAKVAEPAKAAEPSKASAAPSAPVQAAAVAAAADAPRAREEARPAAPEPVRSEAKPLADAGRASTAPAAVASVASAASAASASQAPRNAVIAEARSCAPPPYPLNAYRNGETGTVLLSLLVGTDGHVVESKVKKSSGWPDLDKAARKALSLCKFKPAENQTEPAWASLAYVWSID